MPTVCVMSPLYTHKANSWRHLSVMLFAVAWECLSAKNVDVPPPHTHIRRYSVQPQPMLYCIHYISDMARPHAMITVREKDWMTVKWLRMVYILIGQGHLQKANSSLCWSWHAYGAVYVCMRMYVCTCVCIYTYVYLYVCVCLCNCFVLLEPLLFDCSGQGWVML